MTAPLKVTTVVEGRPLPPVHTSAKCRCSGFATVVLTVHPCGCYDWLCVGCSDKPVRASLTITPGTTTARHTCGYTAPLSHFHVTREPAVEP